MDIYVVKEGDSVDTVSAAYGVAPERVIYINQLVYPYALAIGQALLIPGEDGEGGGSPIVTNGYAYPFISEWVLRQTLPYLTELSIFSYGFTAEGELIPPLWEEDWMIALAEEYRTAAILTLTPLGPDGRFNNSLVSAVSNDEGAQSRLIAGLMTTVGEKGYRGIDIDFEYVKAEDREAFAAFVRNVRSAAAALGVRVSVALAPKVSATQPGLLYEGKDYGLLGAAADSVLLMTYEWGYTYGPAMAVAPINKVREVVDYAITEIPAKKINLGIPNYGYDWTLPYVRGSSRARTIGNVEAVQTAIRYGVPILFDTTAMSPYYTYVENGREHEVWFEDVRSLSAKFSLIEEYGLMGAGYWQIMQLFRANWLLLANHLGVIKR